MKLFSLVNHKVEILPEARLIREFSSLSIEELGYVYFMEDYQSTYQSYPEEVREQKIIKDLGIKEVTADMKRACLKYNELQETLSMKLLKSARGAIQKLSEFFDKEGPRSRNYVKNLESIGKLIESLDRLETKVKREISIEGKSKANRKINIFED